MPSKLSSLRHDDLDNYDVDDFDDDPFASSPPPDALDKSGAAATASKKRKQNDAGLGIDEEVEVKKKVREPAIKLDEERLLGPAGIPKLRSRAAKLRLKGKGHEFSDAERLLSFYQLWLDDLFPKARFLDALAMVEKAGHKKRLQVARNEWINEGKPKAVSAEDFTVEDLEIEDRAGDAEVQSAAAAKTPAPGDDDDDVPGDDDLYGATPPRATKPTAPTMPRTDEPDEDDLEALMAEAESMDNHNNNNNAPRKPPPGPTPIPKAANPAHAEEPDEDDLDALIAEAESTDRNRTNASAATGGSSSSAKPADKGADGGSGGKDFADEEEAMQELEGLW